MTVKELLENYNELNTRYSYGRLDPDLSIKLETLNDMFDNNELIRYTESGMGVIKAHYKYGKHYQEIADEMHLEVRTVYRRRAYAILQIAIILDMDPE